MELTFTALHFYYIISGIFLIAQTVLLIKYGKSVGSYLAKRYKIKIEGESARLLFQKQAEVRLKELNAEERKSKQKEKDDKAKKIQDDIDTMPDCWKSLYYNAKSCNRLVARMELLRSFCKERVKDDSIVYPADGPIHCGTPHITGTQEYKFLALLEENPDSNKWLNNEEKANVTEVATLLAPYVRA